MEKVREDPEKKCKELREVIINKFPERVTDNLKKSELKY